MTKSVILHATTLTQDGKIFITQSVRDAMGWIPGTKLDITELDGNRILIHEAIPKELIDQPEKLEEWHQEQKCKAIRLYKSAGGS